MRPKAAGLMETSLDFVKDVSKKLAAGISLALVITLALLALSIVWISLGGTRFLGLGTTFKYYIEEGESFNDITPIRTTTSAGDVTFGATDGSSTITVN